MGPEVYIWNQGARAAICAGSVWLWRTMAAPAAALSAAITATWTFENCVLGTGHILGLGAPRALPARYRYAVYAIGPPLFPVASKCDFNDTAAFATRAFEQRNR